MAKWATDCSMAKTFLGPFSLAPKLGSPEQHSMRKERTKLQGYRLKYVVFSWLQTFSGGFSDLRPVEFAQTFLLSTLGLCSSAVEDSSASSSSRLYLQIPEITQKGPELLFPQPDSGNYTTEMGTALAIPLFSTYGINRCACHPENPLLCCSVASCYLFK